MTTLNLTTYDAGLSLSLAYRTLNSFMSAFLAPFSLSLPEWKLLGRLSHNDSLSPTQIAQLIGVRPPIATRMLKGLEHKKLLHRRHSHDDNRRVFVTITAKGKQLVSDIEPRLRPALAAFLNGIDRDELAAFLHVTAQIAAKLGDVYEQPQIG